jgi:hypothetical protein
MANRRTKSETGHSIQCVRVKGVVGAAWGPYEC